MKKLSMQIISIDLIYKFLIFLIVLLLSIALISRWKRRDEARKVAYEALSRALHWPIIFSDDFSSNINGWPTGLYDEALGKGDSWIGEGVYHWEVNPNQGITTWALPEVNPVSKFYMKVDARLVGASTGAAWNPYFGMIFRFVDDENYYIFTHSERIDHYSDDVYYGYRIFGVVYENEWNPIISGSTSKGDLYLDSPINFRHPDGWAHLGVIAEGTHFYFFIDGEYVGSSEDSHHRSGLIGLVIDLFEGDEAVIEFDNLELRTP